MLLALYSCPSSCKPGLALKSKALVKENNRDSLLTIFRHIHTLLSRHVIALLLWSQVWNLKEQSVFMRLEFLKNHLIDNVNTVLVGPGSTFKIGYRSEHLEALNLGDVVASWDGHLLGYNHWHLLTGLRRICFAAIRSWNFCLCHCGRRQWGVRL